MAADEAAVPYDERRRKFINPKPQACSGCDTFQRDAFFRRNFGRTSLPSCIGLAGQFALDDCVE
jgi:hypothetical protein